MTKRCRLGVLASHPIQYFTPLYSRLASDPRIDLEVLFYSDYGVVPRFDREFGRPIRWDVEQLSNYRHRFLRNWSPIRDTFNPLHAFNPAVVPAVMSSYDAIWLNGYTYPSNWLAFGAARLRGVPILFRSELRIDDRRRRGVPAAIRDRAIRTWVASSAALLYIGQANRRAYVAYGAPESRLFFAPYSVDVARIREIAALDRGELRRKWDMSADAFVLLYVGKLTARKHPELLLHAANRLRDLPALTVVVVGSGPLEGELRDLASSLGLDNVRFTGFVNQRDLPQLYALSDVFVMPSEDEPWGLVLNEAMAAGAVPVATPEVGAVADLIEDGKTGFVVDVGDLDAVCARVRALAADPARRHCMSAAARERAGKYDYDATVAGITGALDALGLLGDVRH